MEEWSNGEWRSGVMEFWSDGKMESWIFLFRNVVAAFFVSIKNITATLFYFSLASFFYKDFVPLGLISFHYSNLPPEAWLCHNTPILHLLPEAWLCHTIPILQHSNIPIPTTPILHLPTQCPVMNLLEI